MNSLLQDIRFGLRMLARTPLFTIAAVLCLGLGIGAVASLFPFFYDFLIDPLPYERSKELVTVFQTLEVRGWTMNANYPDYLLWREQNHSFASLSASDWSRYTLTGTGEPVLLEGAAVTAAYFEVYREQPLLGRLITFEDEREDAPRVVVLDHRFWHSRFNSDPGVLGTAITLDGRSYTVIGVMREEFIDPDQVSFWTALQPADGMVRGSYFLDVVGRLRPGATITDAQLEMDALAARAAEQYPGTNTGVGVRLRSLEDNLLNEYREPVTIFLGVVIFILLLACANVANLLLARAAAREREIAVRVSLGAGRRRVMRQLLTESILLALVGGALGIALGSIGRDLIVRYIPEEIPYYLEFAINLPVLLILIGITTLCGILFGMAPAVSTARGNIHQVLVEGSGRGSGGSRLAWFRSFLVVFEICLAVIVLSGAGLMMKGFLNLYDVDPGFDPDNKLTLRLSLPETEYGTFEQLSDFWRTTLERVAVIPGVTGAAMNSHLPMSQSNRASGITIDGIEPPPENQPRIANTRIVSNGYFADMGIPLLRGRTFQDTDQRNSRQVMVINQRLAESFWHDEDPIGERIAFGPEPESEDWYEIIGVVGDVRQAGLNRPVEWCVYLTMAQSMNQRNFMVVSTTADPLLMANPVRNAVWSVDHDLPIPEVITMRMLMRRSNWEEPLYTLLFGVFSVIALLLASVGVYGVIAYSVTQRRREFGIRMALGADKRMVQRLVVSKGVRLGGIGLLIGLVGAFLVMRVLQSLIYGIRYDDVVVYALTALLMTAVVLLASWLPARRAGQIDPVESLRAE